MARQAGPHYIIGKLDGKIYYKSKGVYFVRKASTTTPKLTKKEKERRNLKEGNFEFGGGAVLSKLFRDTFDSVVAPYKGRALAGRLTGVFRKIIKEGSGREGMRKAEIRNNKELLKAFQFHDRNVFDQVFKAKLSLAVKKGRKKIAMVVPTFSIKDSISKPAGATHFRITMVAGILSDHIYSKSKKKYVPSEASLNGKSITVYSDYIDLTKSTIELHLVSKFNSSIPEDCSVVVLTEIQFYKEEAGKYYDLKTKRALMVSEIF